MAKKSNMVAVYNGTAAEAHGIREALERHGIRFEMGDQTVPLDDPVGGLAVGGIATVEVLVPPEDYDRAKRIIAGQ